MGNNQNKIKIMMIEDHKLVRVGLRTLFEDIANKPQLFAVFICNFLNLTVVA